MAAQLNNVEVATFTEKPRLFPVNEYDAIVNWGDGTTPDTGTITDLGNGTYGVFDSHVYTTVGNYVLSVTVTDPNGLSGTGQSPIIVTDSPLIAIPTTIDATLGTTFTGVVGSFSDSNLYASASDFTAQITWGDGHVSTGKITDVGPDGQGNEIYDVTGTNTYLVYGTFTVSILVTSDGGSTTTINSIGDVSDAPIAAVSKTFSGIEGATINTVVASFTSGNPRAVVSDFTAQINWGDGTPVVTTDYTISNRGTRFDISASHTYHEFGTYPVTVTILSAGGTSAVANSTATMNDAPLTASPADFSTTIGVPFSGVVATIGDDNPFGVASDYTATLINWGDGTPPTPAVVVATGSGQFNVSGAHTYAVYGSYPVTVQVVSRGGNTATANGQATVYDAAITAKGATLTGEAGAAATSQVATFTDAYALAPLAQFTVTISWGDGSTETPGSISQPGGVGTPFIVTGTHAYALAQSFPITVNITDPGGSDATASSSITINDSPITASSVIIPAPAHEGAAYSGSVATFTTPNTLAGPSSYIAQINWGDGTTSAGTITEATSNKLPVPGSFIVTPLTPHIFGPTAHYVITTTIISLGGSRATATDPVNVVDGLIVGIPVSAINTTAGTTFTGTVAHFTQYAAAPVTSLSATINWGNGNVSAGTVVAESDGSFVVKGTNLYTNNGTYNISVAISTTGGSSATLTAGAIVADPALASTVGVVAGVVDVPFSGIVATFSDPNFYAPANQFRAIINWGDGSPAQAGVLQGASGSFVVTGVHTYLTGTSALPFSVTIVHTGPQGTGSSTEVVGNARILAQLTGSMTRSSDTGYSNDDGITSDTKPVFTGLGQPGATVILYATPTGGSATSVGSALVNSSGNWTVQISPLGSGSYTMTASMIDAVTGADVENIGLAVTPGNPTLQINTAGPTVAGIAFYPKAGQLVVTFQDAGAGMSPAGLYNAANFQLGTPAGLGLSLFAPKSINVSWQSGGVAVATVNYNLKAKAGEYVITLNSTGLTDLAGNILNEQYFVTFPQVGNSPNPNYVAQFTVSKNLTATGPLLYVSKAEQIAAHNYSLKTQGARSIKAAQVTTYSPSVPKPSKAAQARLISPRVREVLTLHSGLDCRAGHSGRLGSRGPSRCSR